MSVNVFFVAVAALADRAEAMRCPRPSVVCIPLLCKVYGAPTPPPAETPRWEHMDELCAHPSEEGWQLMSRMGIVLFGLFLSFAVMFAACSPTLTAAQALGTLHLCCDRDSIPCARHGTPPLPNLAKTPFPSASMEINPS